MAVAALVMEHGGGEEAAIAALLHDAIEDQNHDGSVPGEIEARFGPSVLALVRACSDSENPFKGKEDWRPRKEHYLHHLSHAPDEALLISAADKLHNARAMLSDYRTIGDELWKRFNAGREDQLWYYGELVTVLRQASSGAQVRSLVDALDIVVTALKEEVAMRATSR